MMQIYNRFACKKFVIIFLKLLTLMKGNELFSVLENITNLKTRAIWWIENFFQKLKFIDVKNSFKNKKNWNVRVFFRAFVREFCIKFEKFAKF